MIVIGVGLVFVGYSVGLWAYCGIRGYNVTLGQVFSTKGPPNVTAAAARTAQAAQQSQARTGATGAPGAGAIPTFRS